MKMDLLQVLAFVMVAAAGGGVVATRDPLLQSMMASFFGLLLSILFTVLQAPDVALSEIVVGAVAFPLMIVLTVAKSTARGGQ
jgi:energy-converting hydrogenase B subunit D